ncbi:hypothetical protein GOP47_0011758 [Adiantum capillus-veneris]|uniref:Carboxypeptidase n=1 Tax=Adiantum capillus-veneris TaxID=13818 RepID=A0A9D4UTX4_ADICA|nr:hypothetical protein GOP47_0011758 [Adiantum capillus-veneris]
MGTEFLWLSLVAISSCAAASGCIHSLEEAAPTATGYLPINQTSGSSMFFAYYEAMQNSTSVATSADFDVSHEDDPTPILLWLQGGPGCSGMIGNFFELGPWRVGEDQCLHRNPAPWNRIFGLLFLDNPVGSGFSIAPLIEDIPTNQAGIARDVYTALQGFYDLFPAFRKRPFYVTGESYAGKYVPSVATYILQKQEQGGWLRLDGVAIGNGLTHPIVQIQDHGPTAYHMGVIDENQRETVDAIAMKVVALIEEENWLDAYHSRVELLDFLTNVTDLATLYDVTKTVGYYLTANGTDYLMAFLNKKEVQTSLLKVEPRLWEECNSTVRERMAADVPKSTMLLVELLLNQSVPVLLYQGQFDLRDGVTSSEAWIRLLNWDGRKSFHAAERKVWKESDITAGYVRSFGSLTHVVISNAGHLVPADQAYNSQRMIEGWITDNGELRAQNSFKFYNTIN